MIIPKKIFITLLICFCLSDTFGQSKKFPSPASADVLVNPVKGNAEATAEGKKVYTLYCVTCHGNKGKGDGIAAPGLSKPPADHTSDFVQKQTDGAIYWIITQGNNPMPTYKTTLTDLQRWQVVNYIRTLAKHK
ncbi:MAG TPA: cytochrome c [Chitinophagaceae bacterium]|nr:cytochrome c [Chitinophagaceae bacterium]